MSEDENLGGEAACWAHLIDDLDAAGATTPALPGPVNLAELARTATAPGAAWSQQSDELNVNLLVFAAGDGVAQHVNDAVDVLLVGVTGSGAVDGDGSRFVLHPGAALIIPRGARRAMHALSESFAYLSCHRRRGELRPIPAR
jgi:quercetin dioxygenase-like cupin family protein